MLPNLSRKCIRRNRAKQAVQIDGAKSGAAEIFSATTLLKQSDLEKPLQKGKIKETTTSLGMHIFIFFIV